LAYHALL